MDINYIFQYQYFSELDKYSKKEIQKELSNLEPENVKNLAGLKKFIEIGGNVSGHKVMEHEGSFVHFYDHTNFNKSVKEYLLNNPRTDVETVEVFQILLGDSYKKHESFRKFCNSFCSNTQLKDWLELESKMNGHLLGLEPLLFKVPYDAESLTFCDDYYEEIQNRLIFLEERLHNNKSDDVEVLWKYEEDPFNFSFEDPVYQSLSLEERKNLILLGNLGLGNSVDEPISDLNMFFPLQENEGLFLSISRYVHTFYGYEEGLYKLLSDSLESWNQTNQTPQLNKLYSQCKTDESKLLKLILDIGSIPHSGLTPRKERVEKNHLFNEMMIWNKVELFLKDINVFDNKNVFHLIDKTKKFLWEEEFKSSGVPLNDLNDYIKTENFNILVERNRSLVILGLVLNAALKKNVLNMNFIEQLNMNQTDSNIKQLSNILKERILFKEVTPNNISNPTVRF